MNKKSLATIQIVDVFGSPISKAQYEVKNQKIGITQQKSIQILYAFFISFCINAQSSLKRHS